MEKCPKCGSSLNTDEKASGKCFSCGITFESNLPKQKNSSYSNDKNCIGNIIKWCGIIIIVFGTIYSFMSASDNEWKYQFSFLLFIVPEFISIISGIIFIGFSEIIQLLDDIKYKIK